MDVELGHGIDGPEAARQILQQRSLPVIFLTSQSEPELVHRARAVTSYGYVRKHANSGVLLSAIDLALNMFHASQRWSRPRPRTDIDRRDNRASGRPGQMVVPEHRRFRHIRAYGCGGPRRAVHRLRPPGGQRQDHRSRSLHGRNTSAGVRSHESPTDKKRLAGLRMEQHTPRWTRRPAPAQIAEKS
jgi:hypothetical protein